MAFAPILSRRLLLARFGAASAVTVAFLSPVSIEDALAAAAKVAANGKSPPPKPPRLKQPAAKPQPVKPQAANPQAANPQAGSLLGAALKPLVMLDPGHGGKDPGAIGRAGAYEKHITLAAAVELKRLLEQSGRYRVELTRTRDIFIPLQHRVERAQRLRADLFLSLHADGLADRGVRGASVYTLAPAASDPQTDALARAENNADRVGGWSRRDASPEVAYILSSLIRQETRTGSARVARALVRSLELDLPMLSHPTRHANFAVLQSADVPSVLIEMGFMSNPKDEAALRKPEHRRRLAIAMRRAVDGYFASLGRAGDPSDGPKHLG